MMILRHRFVYLFVIFLILQLFIISHAKAEYRVYKLGVTYEPGQAEVEVLTTLDDQQYETYYKVSANQVTRLIDHWMCWGRTDNFQEYCNKPINPKARIPANDSKRLEAIKIKIQTQTKAREVFPRLPKTKPLPVDCMLK